MPSENFHRVSELYTGPLRWLPQRTLYLTVHGSHAYGTSRPESDWDFRGVAIPPKEYFLGLANFEQAELKGDPDLIIFALRKFVQLASAGNPNILEILHTNPSDHVHVSALGAELLEHRGLFLSRRVKHTFSGYAMSQLKRLETHRRWLQHPPKAQPQREDYGLGPFTLIPKDQLAAAESLMRKKVESWQMDLEPLSEASKIEFQERLSTILADMQMASDGDQMLGAGRALGLSSNFMEVLERERRYATAKREWDQYQEWKRTRNEARAALEAQYGYDSKHASHLVRLMRMAGEMLQEGVVRVKRPDADELRHIRNGGWSYEKLMEFATTQDALLNTYMADSPLPARPDMHAIEQLCIRLHERALSLA